LSQRTGEGSRGGGAGVDGTVLRCADVIDAIETSNSVEEPISKAIRVI
jgi:hypothetical protein